MYAHSDNSSSPPSASDSQRSETSGGSQEDMTRPWSPGSEDLNAFETPLLRIWGYFQDKSRPPTKLFEQEEDARRGASASNYTQYHLKLSHHDSKDGQADLSKPRWFDDLSAFEEPDLKLNRQKVAQNLPIRQDRLVSPEYWEPIEIRLYHEVEHEHWVLVHLVLYDWTRSTSTVVHSPPTALLSQHVSSYIHAYSRESRWGKAAADSSFLLREPAETEAALPIRGRKRRALRHSAGVKANDSTDQRHSTPNPSVVPVQDTVPQLRGRMKRRLRRGRAHVRDHNPIVRKTGTPDTATKDNQEPGTSLNKGYGVIEYLKKCGLAVQVLESPVIAVVESFQPVYLEPDLMVEYHPGDEAIMIPVKDPTSDYILGSLLIAKAAFSKRREKAPWDSSIVDRTTIAVTKLGISVDSDRNGPPVSRKDYWQKFPVCASELYENESSGRNNISHMAFAIQWSYQCPALFSPDESRGLYATEEEYSRESFLVSPHDFFSAIPPFAGSKTAETLRWLSNTSETWHDQKLQWKNLKIQNILAAVDETTDAESLSPVPAPLEESHSTLGKVDYYFTRALGLLEFQDSRYGDRLKEYTETEQSIQSSSPQRRSSTESALALEAEYPGRTQKPLDAPDDLEVALPIERSASPSQESSNLSESDSGDYFGPSVDADENEVADSESIDEFEKDFKGAHVYVNETYGNYREIFHGTRYFGLVPWWTQLNHAKNVLRIMNDSKHHQSLRAHAILQYSLCLFSGFGVAQDAKKGLEWFRLAAVAGSQRARAVVRRLFRSYGQELPDELPQPGWLVQGAEAHSQWSLEELQHEDHPAFQAELRKQAFKSLETYWTEEAEELEKSFHEVESEIQDRLNRLSDHKEEASNDSRSERFMKAGGLRWATCYADTAAVSLVLRLHMASMSLRHRRTANNTLHPLLIAALSAGHIEAVHLFLDQMLVNNEQPYRSYGYNPFFALHYVPDDEVPTIIAKLVQLGEDVNEQVNVFESSRNSFLLREYDDDIGNHWYSSSNGLNITPLRWAVENHRPAVVKALLDHGAVFPRVPCAQTYVKLHPEGFDPEHATVPVLDSPCYDLEILKMFFDRHGREQVKTTVFSETPLGLIATEPDGPERRLRIGQLARRGNLFHVLDLIRTHQSGSDPELFHAAVANSHLDIVEYLILRGVDVELRHRGLTPLHTAVLHGHRDIFDRLVDHGANLRATTTRRGISAIHLIFWKPKATETELYMLSELQRRGVDVLARDSAFGKNVSPLHLAVIGARVAAVDWLLQHGADRGMPLGEEGVMPSLAGARLTDWGTARSERVESNYVGIEYHGRVVVPLKGLTALGVLLQRWDMYTPEDFVRLIGMLCPVDGELRDFHTRPDMAQTALHLASCFPTLVRAGVLEYVLERGRGAGLHVDIVDCDGDTPLHYAMLLGGGSAKRLVSIGADPGIRNAHGMTPADLRFRGHMYQIEKDPKRFPLKSLEFEGQSSPYADELDEASAQSMAAEHGTPIARLWDRIDKGIVFRDVWDVEARAWRTLSDDVGLRLRVGGRVR